MIHQRLYSCFSSWFWSSRESSYKFQNLKVLNGHRATILNILFVSYVNMYRFVTLNLPVDLQCNQKCPCIPGLEVITLLSRDFLANTTTGMYMVLFSLMSDNMSMYFVSNFDLCFLLSRLSLPITLDLVRPPVATEDWTRQENNSQVSLSSFHHLNFRLPSDCISTKSNIKF